MLRRSSGASVRVRSEFFFRRSLVRSTSVSEKGRCFSGVYECFEDCLREQRFGPGARFGPSGANSSCRMTLRAMYCSPDGLHLPAIHLCLAQLAQMVLNRVIPCPRFAESNRARPSSFLRVCSYECFVGLLSFRRLLFVSEKGRCFSVREDCLREQGSVRATSGANSSCRMTLRAMYCSPDGLHLPPIHLCLAQLAQMVLNRVIPSPRFAERNRARPSSFLRVCSYECFVGFL